MDEIDIRLIQVLMMNARTPYRELASELSISLQSVHRRIQMMMESGVIKGFTASVSPSYLGAVAIDVIGRSNATDIDEVVRRLGASEFTKDILLGAGNYVTIPALLKRNSNLEPYLQFLIDNGQLSDVWMGMESFGFAGKRRVEDEAESGDLTPLDFRIVNSLRADSRKPVNQVADEVGVSSKTVARRLDRMIEERKISLYIKWYPGMTSGVISFLLIHLKQGADKKALAVRLTNRYSPRIVFLRSYSNHPDVFGAISWTPTPVQQNELTNELTKEDTVKNVVPFVLLRKFEFQTWVDDLISSKAARRES
jgi:DNA-binding Lrp family transcriptional regulator